MQIPDPNWKIRSRSCPFYSKGNCIFSMHCNFLHDTDDEPRIPTLDDEERNIFGLTTPVQLSETYTYSDSVLIPDENDDSYSDNSDDEEEDSDQDSPTIRKPVLSDSTNNRDSLNTITGRSHDSVATIKGGVGDFHPGSNPTQPYGSLSSSKGLPFDRPTRSSRSFSASAGRVPLKNISLLSPFVETSSGSSISTPTSITSATAQELEIPSRLCQPLAPDFVLANTTSSSLLANRLAKSQGNRLISPHAASSAEPSTPFSAGALNVSSPDDDSVPVDGVRSRDPVSDTQAAENTPSWLRPLRLASALTPQTNTQSFTTSDVSQEPSALQLDSSSSRKPSATSESFYDTSITYDSPDEFKTSNLLSLIPADTPHTIVLSDTEGYISPFTLSRQGSVDIDMSQFPRLPVSPQSSMHRSSSSQASNTLSELLGHSSRRLPAIQRIHTSKSSRSATESPEQSSAFPRGEATTASEQFQSALERRMKHIRESSRFLSSEFPGGRSYPDLKSHSHSRDSSMAASHSDSWLSLPHVSTLSHPASLPASAVLRNAILTADVFGQTSLSDSSLMQQVQSSPPRESLHQSSSSSVSSSISYLSTRVADITHPPPSATSPRPSLLFAIASDQPAEVERLLSSGEASANESAGSETGPLEFTVANDGLKNKTEIVKTLLKYGAVQGPLNTIARSDGSSSGSVSLYQSPVLTKKLEDSLNPALKYYMTRPESLDAGSKPAMEALQKSLFAPLSRAKYDIIGQDRALDELYRVLGMYSQRKGKNPLVIMLCGASGLGKSLLAQRVGSLLDVPTHTINMTALRSQQDLWQCLSTGVHDASPDLNLSEFLVENEGKRCVVVLDEIEKVGDGKLLNPLLLPWDIGRCSLEQKKHTDTSKVIWIATSNLGQRFIAEHAATWAHPDIPPTRSEYIQLATAIRKGITDVIGASLLSRVTTILPFLSFTEREKIAIGTEALLSHGDEPMSSAEIETLVRCAVKSADFVEEEGARSLQRVVEIHMSMRTLEDVTMAPRSDTMHE